MMKLVAEFTNRNKDEYKIERDKWGKFYVKCNNKNVQIKLTAEEIVGYLCNALEGH